MEVDDLEKVLEIEKKSFSAPWPYDLFLSELTQNRHAQYFVLEKYKEVIGYLGFLHKGKSFHITNIAITEKCRREGNGKKLLEFVEKMAATHKVKRIFLEVRKSNCIAQDMYRKYGYKVTELLKNYYQEEKEDALVMEKKLN